MNKKDSPVFACLFILLFAASCAPEKKTLTIAEQYGLAYAPLQILKDRRILEDMLPDTEIRWVQMDNTAAIREAVVAGKVDAGCLGIPPFLIGRDKGMEWKIISGLSRSPVALVADSRKLSSLADVTDDMRIALPQPGSIQHILLSMALERAGENPKKLDGQLVTLNHPDGMAALLSSGVEAHFTAPPYLFQEIASESEGTRPYRVIVSGNEAFGGDYSFIVAMAGERFLKARPADAEKLRTAISGAIDFLDRNPDESAEILARMYGMDEAIIRDFLSREGMTYTTEVEGMDRFISFMTAQGYLKSAMQAREVLYP